MKYIVVDTECTGLKRIAGNVKKPLPLSQNGSEVIQIGGLFLNEELVPIKGFCHYCDCLASDSEKRAKSVHNIDIEVIRQYIPNVYLEEVLSKYLPEFFEDNVVFIGYNVLFDMKLIRQSVRDFCIDFQLPSELKDGDLSKGGRYYIDVMSYLGKKRRLGSYVKELNKSMSAFMNAVGVHLPIDHNMVYTGRENIVLPLPEGNAGEGLHNSLVDSLYTYLLFYERIHKVSRIQLN